MSASLSKRSFRTSRASSRTRASREYDEQVPVAAAPARVDVQGGERRPAAHHGHAGDDAHPREPPRLPAELHRRPELREPHPRAARDEVHRRHEPREEHRADDARGDVLPRRRRAVRRRSRPRARRVQRGVCVRGVGRGERHQVQVVRDPRPPLARRSATTRKRKTCTTSRCATRRTTTSPRRRWRSRR